MIFISNTKKIMNFSALFTIFITETLGCVASSQFDIVNNCQVNGKYTVFVMEKF